MPLLMLAAITLAYPLPASVWQPLVILHDSAYLYLFVKAFSLPSTRYAVIL
jgi:hypothetical protein